ncbi:hypothetical protein Tco_0385812 [Tanacetum coccineum]
MYKELMYGEDKELDLHDISLFDAEFGKMLQALVCLKQYLESILDRNQILNLRFRGTPVEDLCLDFTLTGYHDYALKENGCVAGTTGFNRYNAPTNAGWVSVAADDELAKCQSCNIKSSEGSSKDSQIDLVVLCMVSFSSQQDKLPDSVPSMNTMASGVRGTDIPSQPVRMEYYLHIWDQFAGKTSTHAQYIILSVLLCLHFAETTFNFNSLVFIDIVELQYPGVKAEFFRFDK